MEKIRLNATEIKYITLFENLTGARIKDCVSEKNTIGFLVENGHMGLAIGKNGSNVSRVMKVIGKNIIVIYFLAAGWLDYSSKNKSWRGLKS